MRIAVCGLLIMDYGLRGRAFRPAGRIMTALSFDRKAYALGDAHDTRKRLSGLQLDRSIANGIINARLSSLTEATSRSKA